MMSGAQPKTGAGGAPKRATHTVAHPKLYLSVNGKLQHVPQGTPIVLSKERAEKAGNKFMAIGNEKSLDLTEKSKD